MSNSLQLYGLYSPWNFSGQNTRVGSLSLSPADLPDPGITPGSPALQEDSLPIELSGKPPSEDKMLLAVKGLLRYSATRKQDKWQY